MKPTGQTKTIKPLISAGEDGPADRTVRNLRAAARQQGRTVSAIAEERLGIA
jgi:hypothetical protein